MKSRILDLYENANNWLAMNTETKLLNKKNKLQEKRFLSSVLSFATEVMPKISSLLKSKNLSNEDRKSAEGCKDATLFFIRYPTKLDVEAAVGLLITLNDVIDMLGISSIMHTTGKTFDRTFDIANVR
jgi:hypothetical protein